MTELGEQFVFMAIALIIISELYWTDKGTAVVFVVLHSGQDSLFAGSRIIDFRPIGFWKRHVGQYQMANARSLLACSWKVEPHPSSSRAQAEVHFLLVVG